jgi:hypothetical protein
MTLEQAVLENLRLLPAPAQQEVLDFAEFLRRNAAPSKAPLKSLRGLWADLKLTSTDEDIAQARREMWAKFPRDVSR